MLYFSLLNLAQGAQERRRKNRHLQGLSTSKEALRTTSTPLTGEICVSLIRRFRSKFYIMVSYAQGDRFVQADVLANQHMPILFIISSWEFKKQISSRKISSVMLRIP